MFLGKKNRRHWSVPTSHFLCSQTQIEKKRLTRSRLPPRVKIYVESRKLRIANICNLLQAKVANRWHLPQSRGAAPRRPSIPSSPSFVVFVVVVVVFFLVYGGMRALERCGEICQGRRDAPRRRWQHPDAPPRGPALTRRRHPRVFSSEDDDGRPGGRTTREGDSGAEGGLVTSLPTIRPLSWIRCRHDARMGTSSSFGVGVPYGASNVVACSASGDMMYGTAGSLLR